MQKKIKNQCRDKKFNYNTFLVNKPIVVNFLSYPIKFILINFHEKAIIIKKISGNLEVCSHRRVSGHEYGTI
jgi:hypothetical protein